MGPQGGRAPHFSLSPHPSPPIPFPTPLIRLFKVKPAVHFFFCRFHFLLKKENSTPHIAGSMEQHRGGLLGNVRGGCAKPGSGEHVCTRVGVERHWFLCSEGDWGATLSSSLFTPFLWVHPCCFFLLQCAAHRPRTPPLTAAGPLRAVPLRRAPSPPPSLLRAGSAGHFRCCLCPVPRWRRRSAADAGGHFRPGNGHGAARLGRLWGRRGSLPAA